MFCDGFIIQSVFLGEMDVLEESLDVPLLPSLVKARLQPRSPYISDPSALDWVYAFEV